MSENKRIPKNDLKVNFTPNEEQKKVVADFYENDVNFLLGDAGTGKTTLACYIALQSLQKRTFEKIIFTRPILKSRVNLLGYTTGSLEEKASIYTQHLIDSLKEIYKPTLIEKYIEKGNMTFEVAELSKGKDWKNSLIICDEFSDLNFFEFRNLITRVAKGSKILFMGSEEQIDYSVKQHSCLNTLNKVKNNLPEGFCWNELTINHRNDSIFKFVKELDKLVD